MHIPTTLKHKPVLVAEDYGRIDGRTAYGSDAQGLSWAWPSGTTGARWTSPPRCGGTPGRSGPASRRSCPSTGCWIWRFWPARPPPFSRGAPPFPRGYDPEHPQVDRIGLQGDAMTVEVCTSSDHIDEDLRLFQDALARDGELLGERMRVLARLLGELGCRG